MKKLFFLTILFSFFAVYAAQKQIEKLQIYVDIGKKMVNDGNYDRKVYELVRRQVVRSLKENINHSAGKKLAIEVILFAEADKEQKLLVHKVMNRGKGMLPDFRHLDREFPENPWANRYILISQKNDDYTNLEYFQQIINDDNNKNTTIVVFTNSNKNITPLSLLFNAKRIGKSLEREAYKMYSPANNVNFVWVHLPNCTVEDEDKQTNFIGAIEADTARGMAVAWELCEPPKQAEIKNEVLKPVKTEPAISFQPHADFYLVNVDNEDIPFDECNPFNCYKQSAPSAIKVNNIKDIKSIRFNVKGTALNKTVNVSNHTYYSFPLSGLDGRHEIVVTCIGKDNQEKEFKCVIVVHEDFEIDVKGQKANSINKEKTIFLDKPFKLAQILIKGIDRYQWTKNGSPFSFNSDTVFQDNDQLELSFTGKDGRNYKQQYRIRRVALIAKAGAKEMTADGKAQIKLSKGASIRFSSVPENNVTWKRNGKTFSAKENQHFTQNETVECSYKAPNGSLLKRSIKITVDKTAAVPKISQPEWKLEKVTVYDNGDEIKPNGSNYKYQLPKKKNSVSLTFKFNISSKGTVEIKGKNETKTENFVSNEHSLIFKPGEYTLSFKSGTKTIDCVVEIEAEEVEEAYQETAPPPPPSTPIPWGTIFLIIAILAAAIVGFVLYKKFSNKIFKIELNGETASRLFGPGEYKIDQNIFPDCEESFTIYLSLSKQEDSVSYLVKFKLPATWTLEVNGYLQTLDNGVSDEIPVASDEYTIKTDDKEMFLKISLDEKEA